MTFVLVRFTVENLDNWKAAFEEAGALRGNYGSLGVRAISRIEDPNLVVIPGEYASREKAQQIVPIRGFRAATKLAGVLTPPEMG